MKHQTPNSKRQGSTKRQASINRASPTPSQIARDQSGNTRAPGGEKPFMRLAGIKRGLPADLSQRKGYSLSRSALPAHFPSMRSPSLMNPKGKLFLFQWDEQTATERASELAADGWLVELEFEEGSRGCRNAKAFGPDVVVLDIANKASHSREVGRALRQSKAFRETPLIFVDGTDNEVSKVKEKVPGAIFTTAGGLPKILAMHAC